MEYESIAKSADCLPLISLIIISAFAIGTYFMGLYIGNRMGRLDQTLDDNDKVIRESISGLSKKIN